jgi:hypothetical protein
VKSTNYTPAYVNGTLTVTQKTMKVVVGNGDGIYGSSPKINQKGYTLEGFVNGDTAAVLSGEATLTTTAELSSPVAAYPIVYKEGSLKAKNYALVGVNGSYTVEKATLTFTAKNASMKKGSSLPKLADSVTGLVNGDTDAKAFTGSPALSTTASSKSATGKYPIAIKVGSLESKNYAFKFVDGTLTITD